MREMIASSDEVSVCNGLSTIEMDKCLSLKTMTKRLSWRSCKDLKLPAIRVCVMIINLTHQDERVAD